MRYSIGRGVAFGLLGGLVASIVLGLLGTFTLHAGGAPFFITASKDLLREAGIAPRPSLLDHPRILGWSVLVFTGLMIGAIFGAIASGSSALRASDTGRGLGLGFAAGAVTWAVLFVPTVTLIIRAVPLTVKSLTAPSQLTMMLLVGGLIANIIFGLVLGGVVGALLPAFGRKGPSSKTENAETAATTTPAGPSTPQSPTPPSPVPQPRLRMNASTA